MQLSKEEWTVVLIVLWRVVRDNKELVQYYLSDDRPHPEVDYAMHAQSRLGSLERSLLLLHWAINECIPAHHPLYRAILRDLSSMKIVQCLCNVNH